MTNNTRSQASQLPVVASQPSMFFIVGIPIVALAAAIPAAAVPCAALPTPVIAPSPSGPPTVSPDTTSPPAPAQRVPPGAGLPAPLVALLRTEGPYLANQVFSTVPAEPLTPIEEDVAAPEWYAVTRGRFVGVVDQFALSAVAISGVAHAARKAYTTQSLALDAFNQALTWGGVQVV
ncbi:hypothetical protein DFH07DRAFT_963656 [Mycena maculata]|uniref:Uncharacterized protein n=1 Tax=Mycena maculata TaxID=230809 RepID=A0AAD7IM56_9AGAR|nr:hypothetical protein DFH07DRAFT_963656 [Mycena maculata]